MKNDEALRKGLLVLLRRGRAHVSFDKAVADLSEDLRGKKPPSAPYSPWQQVEHIRITQWDILEYIRTAGYPQVSFMPRIIARARTDGINLFERSGGTG